MTQLSADLLRSSTAGTWIARLPELPLPADRPADMPAPASMLHPPLVGVSTDTRATMPGNVFVALRGERFDAHEFLLDAVRAGASALIVDDPSRVPADAFRAATGGRGVGILKVADTGRALLALAAAYRRTFTRTKVIAVCGSNGKTTTTRLIHQVLSTTLRGSHSPKSFNNSIGVPLTLLAVQPGDQFVVCEVGTSAPGEIAALGEVVRPDIAVITSIGREHLEFLGDLAGVVREESAIIKALNPQAAGGGVAVCNADSPELLAQLRAHAGGGSGGGGATTVTVGSSVEASLRVSDVRHAWNEVTRQFTLRFTVNGRTEYTLPVLGEHNATNALAAIAVARRLNIDESKIAGALACARLPEMRLEQRAVSLGAAPSEGGAAAVDAAGGPRPVHVIADCYNANPDSMQAALRTLASLEWPGRRVCVLGDMLELGPDSARLHEGVLDQVAAHESLVGLVVCVGEQMSRAVGSLHARGWSAARAVAVSSVDRPELADAVAALVRSGDLVLLKGSRRMGLERVLGALERRGTLRSAAEVPAPSVRPSAPTSVTSR